MISTKIKVGIVLGIWLLCGLLCVPLLSRIYRQLAWYPMPTHSRVLSLRRQPGHDLPFLEIQPAEPFYRPHPILGYGVAPGRFDLRLCLDPPHGAAIEFSVENGDDGYRVTSERPEARLRQPSLWICGGSFSYGWGVSDPETLGWRLQSGLGDLRVRNLAVPGYGNVQGLLQLRQAVQSGAELPRILVVAYSNFHWPRNVAAPKYLRSMYTNRLLNPGAFAPEDFRYPQAALDDEQQLQVTLVSLDDRAGQPDPEVPDQDRVTRAVLKAIYDLCRAHHIEPVLGVQTAGPVDPVVRFCRRLGYRVIDMQVDYYDHRYNHYPVDMHPNALAHEIYAEKLLAGLRPILADLK